nr:AEC family transporter [uncultured Desulfobacter sp.]
MNMFIVVAQSVGIMFFIGALGFLVAKRRLVPTDVVDLLSPLVLEIALPSLIFFRIIKTFNPADFPDWYLYPVYWVIFTIAAIIMANLFKRLFQKEIQEETNLSLVFQNGLFIPIIVITETFGADSSLLIHLFLFTIFYPAFFFNTYHLFFKKGQRQFGLKKTINPVLIATSLGLILKFTHGDQLIPEFILTALKMVGGMTIPLLMLIIGSNIYVDLQKTGTIVWGEIIKFIVIKNILFPILGMGIILFFKLEYNIAFIIVMQAATPPLTALPIFASRAQGNREIVNQYLVSSLLFTLLSLPSILFVFDYLYHYLK